jgi:hypothetical protein
MALRTRILIFTTALIGAVAPIPLAASAAPLSLAASVAPISAAAAPASAVASSAVTRAPASSSDPTLTRAARTSRSSRAGISVRTWANSATARRVAARESGGNCRAVSPSGKYRGKWQMDASFWRSYGGRAYAATPDRASCAQQDVVAHRGWVARWWQPWSTF